MACPRSITRGFTLIEVLIAVSLVAAMILFLADVAGLAARTEQRLTESGPFVTRTLMAKGWLRDALTGLARSDSQDQPFAGESLRVSGTTQQSLFGPIGVNVRFSIEIARTPEGSAVIQYRDSYHADWLPIMQADASARFWFRDSAGLRHEQWPPAGVAPGFAPSGAPNPLPLPALVQLVNDGSTQLSERDLSYEFAAAPRAHVQPKNRALQGLGVP